MYPLKKLQNKMLDLAIIVDDFCNRNNLEYSICGGTLIGAVRHSGFIPWDDDIDIIMPRRDFNILLKIWEDFDNVSMICNGDDGYYKVGTPAKIHFCDTRLSEINEFENGMPEFNPYGIFIDVFPVDNYPDNILSKLINNYWGKLLLIKEMSNFHMKKKKESLSFRFATFLIKLVPYKLLLIIDKLFTIYLNRFESKNCKVGYGRETPFCNLWLDYKDIWPAKREYLFEGKLLKSPNDSHKYLKCRFGDYMKLPPENARFKHIVKVAEIHELQ